MRCGAVRCGAVRCGAVRCGAVRCGAVRCDAMRCDAMRCDAMRCDAMIWGNSAGFRTVSAVVGQIGVNGALYVPKIATVAFTILMCYAIWRSNV